MQAILIFAGFTCLKVRLLTLRQRYIPHIGGGFSSWPFVWQVVTGLPFIVNPSSHLNWIVVSVPLDESNVERPAVV